MDGGIAAPSPADDAASADQESLDTPQASRRQRSVPGGGKSNSVRLQPTTPPSRERGSH